jgi:hypothetical protein
MFAEHGALHPEQLPDSVSTEIPLRALVETAAVGFPSLDFATRNHDIVSFNSAFHAASERIKLSGKSRKSSSLQKRRLSCCYCLPVAPFDLEAMCIQAKPTNDCRCSACPVSCDKTAFVGYDVCSAPFYLS